MPRLSFVLAAAIALVGVAAHSVRADVKSARASMVCGDYASSSRPPSE